MRILFLIDCQSNSLWEDKNEREEGEKDSVKVYRQKSFHINIFKVNGESFYDLLQIFDS